MAELFGFQITRANQKAKDGGTPQSFTVPTADDGTTTISAGGYFGSYLDQEGGAKNEEELLSLIAESAVIEISSGPSTECLYSASKYLTKSCKKWPKKLSSCSYFLNQ